MSPNFFVVGPTAGGSSSRLWRGQIWNGGGISQGNMPMTDPWDEFGIFTYIFMVDFLFSCRYIPVTWIL